MGDRGNIAVLQERGQIWFYTHWRGSEITEIVKNALSKGKNRWTDPPYFAKIIFCELVPEKYHYDETGFGIDLGVGDNSHPIIVVDIPKQRIFYINENELDDGQIPENWEPETSWGFEGFVSAEKI